MGMGLLYYQEMAEEERRRINPTLAEIEEELKELEARKKKLEALYATKCDVVIMKAIEKSAQEKKIKRLSTSPSIIIVNYSDISGKPWNVEFHDWYGSKKVLLEYLSKETPSRWHDCIIELANKAKNGVVYVPSKVSNGYEKKTPISIEFIQEVLKNIEGKL